MENLDSSVWRLHRRIPSDTSIGSSLAVELIEAMARKGWPEDDRFRVRLAYEEAIVNAIRHGNQCSVEKTVDVRLECDGRRVRIEIADQGDGFDLATVPDPRREDLLEVPGGRGVLLIGEIMNEVRYSKSGNRITMIKTRSETPPAASDRSNRER